MNVCQAFLTELGRRHLHVGIAAVALVFGSMAFSGCVVAGLVVGVGEVAVATVSTAGKVAGAAVKATGHVAASSVDASGEVGDSTLKLAAKLSQDGMVVFFDPKSGTVWRTPWSKGLKMLAASQTAQVGPALQAARVIRGAKAAAVEPKSVANLLVKSGDVVELARAPSA